MSELQGLNPRARGWLRFIWDKATTQDDWSSSGEPNAWWDKSSTPPMCSFPRFDVSETSYALPLMVDQTPAWREVYTRIADELVGRYTTYWGAIDWLTYIGHSPHQDSYPPEWLVFMPEHMRGRYDPPGWTANGVEPWGLQPDPIGADGNLFFRGFFNLLLGTYSYVSGDDKWESPFEVTGYQERMFEWSQHSITQFIEDQWAERPQGAQCENTKIWPYCLSAAGLSLQLYDKIFEGKTHWVYDQWIEYAKKHFTVRNVSGDITSFAFYYDPLEKFAYSPPLGLNGYGMLAPLFYLYPQAPEFGLQLYEAGVKALGWNDRTKSLVQAFDDPRWITMTMMLAREVGDVTTERRMKAVAEQEWGPNYFEGDDDRFAWGFGMDEPHPRGQLNGLMILSEIGGPGAWSKVYKGPREGQFDLPTVVGVDYPTLGISEAFNDTVDNMLHVVTYAATSDRRGSPTSWKVTQLSDPKAVQVYCDDELFSDWGQIDDHTIEINSDIGEHRFRIVNTVAGAAADIGAASLSASNGAVLSTGEASRSPGSTTSHYRPAAPPSCACC
jgi:hypothetical protein